MKKILILILVIMMITALATACTPTAKPTPTDTTTVAPTDTSDNKPVSSTVASTVSFTNKFGTAKTICAHSGCNNYIASSGDTNCCTTHSQNCLDCDVYIDEDATFCMSCIEKAMKPSTSSNSSSSNSSYSPPSSGGEFWCMGKNDTCQNKTSDPLDLFCSSCDSNNDNVED